MIYHIPITKQNTHLHSVYELTLFQIHPPLYFLTLPNWLTIKFHYSLIGPRVKIMNMLPPLVDT